MAASPITGATVRTTTTAGRPVAMAAGTTTDGIARRRCGHDPLPGMDRPGPRHHGDGPIRRVRHRGSARCLEAAHRQRTLVHVRVEHLDDDRAIVDAVLAGTGRRSDGSSSASRRSLVRACHRILGDHAEAEDAAQEAFVTAFRSLATWRGDGPFGAWLTRIAVRIALRQAGRRRTVAWRDPHPPATPDATSTVADRAADARARWPRPR